MTLFVFRGAKSHEWTFYDLVKLVPKNPANTQKRVLLSNKYIEKGVNSEW